MRASPVRFALPGYRTAQLDDPPEVEGGPHTRPEAKDILTAWQHALRGGCCCSGLAVRSVQCSAARGVVFAGGVCRLCCRSSSVRWSAPRPKLLGVLCHIFVVVWLVMVVKTFGGGVLCQLLDTLRHSRDNQSEELAKRNNNCSVNDVKLRTLLSGSGVSQSTLRSYHYVPKSWGHLLIRFIPNDPYISGQNGGIIQGGCATRAQHDASRAAARSHQTGHRSDRSPIPTST